METLPNLYPWLPLGNRIGGRKEVPSFKFMKYSVFVFVLTLYRNVVKTQKDTQIISPKLNEFLRCEHTYVTNTSQDMDLSSLPPYTLSKPLSPTPQGNHCSGSNTIDYLCHFLDFM